MTPSSCLLFWLLCGAAAFARNDVVVKYNKLFVDGREFIVRGMSYNPAPIGLESGARAKRSQPLC